ncbi:hypothetical protein [Allorhodopirellula heiligendammensis]|uniref:Uncharacterized protein n=1 Tax=Allorhodopirellula heiligendammensis TaxID=2714739 RepID=A0A5C6C0Q3_9BACT|nr:hypothetical protein [Allorhodopirellula heiligendammensis]TWU16439.1 hypothetical protein Poly21_36440 [Allorhodopirellula heiligendammensis]
MRIPSELHGESLYGRKLGRAAAAPGQSWRRVIRLLVVMTLILVVMRQAAHSGVYQILFPTAQRKQLTHRRPPADVQRTLTSQHRSAEMQPLQQSSGAWVDAQSTAELSAVLATWLHADPSLPEGNGDPIPPTASDPAHLALAIQQQLIAEMLDGTVWRAADGPGLTATLALHARANARFEELNQSRPRAVPTGVLPLLQQPEVYRGHTMVASGELVQIERVVASANSFGITSYWNLWLLPNDASNRPWLVVVPELPQEIASLTDSQDNEHPLASSTEEGVSAKQSWSVKSPRPKLEIDGEFLKRLSYPSEAGVELTPVVAGHIATIRANGNPVVAAAIGESASTDAPLNDATNHDVPLLWIAVGSASVGLLIAMWVMWQTAAQNRQLRARRNRHHVKLGLAWLLCCVAAPSPVSAQTMMDLLPGYDPTRLQELAQQADPTLDNPRVNVDEIAKIVFRINRLSQTALQTRAAQSGAPPVVGDAVPIDGAIVASTSLNISPELQEYLDLQQIDMTQLADVAGVPHILFSKRLPTEADTGDRVSGVAVRIRTSSPNPTEIQIQGSDNQAPPNLIVDVAGRLNWAPAHPRSPAEAVLAMSGVDLSRLADIDKLDRQPLSDSDSSLFYPMMGAASMAGQHHGDEMPLDDGQLNTAFRSMRESAVAVSPVELLQNPHQFTGDWIELDVETVRITRVAVESELRRREIGGEYYYEIDAIGDLGKVELRIEVPGGDPVTMENRYPVTIVTAHVPDFLQPSADNEEELVVTRNVPIRVEGFFYRLWSYESDFMRSHGGKQFAPLIIAGVIADQRSGSTDPLGVQVIGNIAAFGVVTAIIAVIIFGIVTRRGDRRAK